MPGRFFVFSAQKLLLLGLTTFILVGVILFNSNASSANEQTNIPIEDSPAMVAVNPFTNIAVITHGHANTDTVSIVDLGSERVMTELAVAKLPSAVAIDTHYNLAVITHEHERLLTFIDLNTNSLIDTLELETKPKFIAINSENHVAAVTSAIDKDVVFVDLNTRAVVAQTDIGINSGDLAIDPQHNIALVLDKNKNNINIIDLNDYTLSQSIALNQKPQAIDVNPETNTAVITNDQDNSVTIVDLFTKRLLTLPLGSSPLDIAINTIDNRAVVLCDKDNKLLLLDLHTNEIIKTYSLNRHSRSVAINHIQNTAIVADDETDNLTVIPLPVSSPLPKIKITSPQDNARIPSHSVDVSGTVENSTRVTVNDINALINGNTFSSQPTFEEGENTILAIATDAYGRTASDAITVNIIPPVKGTITGTVINSLTGSLLPSAAVTITDGQGNIKTISTNGSGAFTAQVEEGAYSGTIVKAWYLPYSFNGSIAIGETNVINAPLKPISPVINNINVTDITESSAKINWTTDQPTQGVIEYGTTTSYGAAISDILEGTTHTVTISNLAPSTTYHFQLFAISSNGTTTYSSDSSLKTNGVIFITINSPVNGAVINNNNVIVTGSIGNPATVETGVTVNGLPASLNNNLFVVNNVPLNAGQNTITVTATDINGTTASKSITVNATIPENYITLSVYPESGIVPLIVSFVISENLSNSILNYQIDFNGDGIMDYSSSTFENINYTYSSEGTYHPQVTVMDSAGNIYVGSSTVTILSKTQLEALLKAKWEGMKSALMAGDMETALSYFMPGNQEKYRQIFTAFGQTKINSIFSGISSIHLSNNYEKVASCGALRAEAGGTYSYPLIFVKDNNGIWKIFEF